MSEQLDEVEIIVCNAAHDETAGPAVNFCFTHCSKNAICSHGNKIIEKAISKGVEEQKITIEEASRMRAILVETRYHLVFNIDRMSAWRKRLRENELEPEILESLEKDLRDDLGDDKSLWRAEQGNMQLKIANPIIGVAKELEKLGLLTCADEIVHLDVEQIVEDSYQEVDELTA